MRDRNKMEDWTAVCWSNKNVKSYQLCGTEIRWRIEQLSVGVTRMALLQKVKARFYLGSTNNWISDLSSTHTQECDFQAKLNTLWARKVLRRKDKYIYIRINRILDQMYIQQNVAPKIDKGTRKCDFFFTIFTTTKNAPWYDYRSYDWQCCIFHLK